MNKNKGFTLLELLIVIGILAILATVIIVAINPAELLRRARDSQRLSDLASITSAISFYLTEASSPTLGTATTSSRELSNNTCDPPLGAATRTVIYYSINNSPDSDAHFHDQNRGIGGYNIGGTCPNCWKKFSTSSQGVSGTDGWIPVNLRGLAAGSPIAKFPIDPRNVTSSSADYHYAYVCQRTPNLAFELFANMESTLYSNGGSQDRESTDGGYASTTYETGSLIFVTSTAIIRIPE